MGARLPCRTTKVEPNLMAPDGHTIGDIFECSPPARYKTGLRQEENGKDCRHFQPLGSSCVESREMFSTKSLRQLEKRGVIRNEAHVVAKPGIIAGNRETADTGTSAGPCLAEFCGIFMTVSAAQGVRGGSRWHNQGQSVRIDSNSSIDLQRERVRSIFDEGAISLLPERFIEKPSAVTTSIH